MSRENFIHQSYYDIQLLIDPVAKFRIGTWFVLHSHKQGINERYDMVRPDARNIPGKIYFFNFMDKFTPCMEPL